MCTTIIIASQYEFYVSPIFWLSFTLSVFRLSVQRCAGGQSSWPPPAASLSVGGTTPDIFVARLHDLGTAWHELKRVVPRSASPPTQARLIVMIEGGAVPCLSPVVTDFPEISRKFEGLRLELVSRNFALVQQKCTPGPICRGLSRSVLCRVAEAQAVRSSFSCRTSRSSYRMSVRSITCRPPGAREQGVRSDLRCRVPPPPAPGRRPRRVCA